MSKCLRCEHGFGTDLRGRCIAALRDAGGSMVYCGCECVFTSAPAEPPRRDSKICTRAWPCRYRDPRQCARDTKLGRDCPAICECTCHAHAEPVRPEGEQEKSFRDLLPLTPVRIAPGEYEVRARDGQRLWFMEGASLTDWICASVNGYDAAVNAIQISTHKCERCNGTGEVEGYGGNMIYCGHCAGRGQKPDFAATPPKTPVVARAAAMRAAEEICKYLYNQGREKFIAAIIMRNLAVTEK